MNYRSIINEVLKGVLDGLLYVVVYFYLLPLLLGYVASSLGAGSYAGNLGGLYAPRVTIIYIALFEGLSVASRILKENVLSPFLESLESLLGAFVVLYLVNVYMPGGYAEASMRLSPAEAVTVRIGFYPLIMIMVLAVYLPLAVVPYIEFFMKER